MYRNIKIDTINKETNIELQLSLFSNGNSWLGDSIAKLNHVNHRYLYIEDDGKIVVTTAQHFSNLSHPSYSAYDIIANRLFRHDELIPGKHMVQLRNADTYYVMTGGLLVHINSLPTKPVEFLKDYTNTLLSLSDRNRDIMRVYQILNGPHEKTGLIDFSIVWQRKVKPQYTFDQLRGIIGHDFDIVD